jgi:hypothetical protein
MNLLHEPINDDDNHGQILLVERKKREERRAGWQKKNKSCQMTVAKGQNRSILVRLWSVDKYKQL